MNTVPNTEVSFIVGQEYNRREDIHKNYSGQRYGGISTPKDHNLIFLFSSTAGEDYGYLDHFDTNGVFHYTGEGQIGDMTFTKGNKAIRDHIEQGKELLLFEEVRSGFHKFNGYCKYLSDHTEPRPDRNGDWRKAIVFELAFNHESFQSNENEEASENVNESIFHEVDLTDRYEAATPLTLAATY